MRKFAVLTLIALLVSACVPKPTPSGPCNITAVNPVPIYMLPSAASDVFSTLGPSSTQVATAKTADGFYGFDPGIAQAGNSGLYRLRWVLKTHDVTTSAGCASIPTVVGPIAGLCYAMLMMDTPIHSSASSSSSVLTTLHNGDFVMVTASASGWLTVDLNVGSANVDQVGFIDVNIIGGLKGTCDGF